MSTPSVSVIIAAYNCANLLSEAVDSVRRQSYQDLEVIIVDDGSTDDTPEVIRRLAEGWQKIRPFFADHGGTPVNKNRGIRLARGEWLALLDADDLWLPEKLARCMEYLAEHPDISIVYTPMKPIRLDGKEMKGHSKPCHSGWITDKLFHSIFVHDPAVVFHRRVVQACGGFDESIPVGSGHEFWLRVSTKFEFGLIDEPLAIRRWRPTSLTRSNRLVGRIAKAKMLERFYFERGGKDFVPRNKALRRLSDVHYKAGKMLLRYRDYHQAREFLTKALEYKSFNFKVWPLYVVSRFGEVFKKSPAVETQPLPLLPLPTPVNLEEHVAYEKATIDGSLCLKKTFSPDDIGKACFQREVLAHEIFANRPWMPQVLKTGDRWLAIPWYDQNSRLDAVVSTLGGSGRYELAKQIGEILFEIFQAGYAHRDFRASKCFLIDGRVVITGFEAMERYPHGKRPAFPTSYDLVGQGLAGVRPNDSIYYTANHPDAIQTVLNVPVDQILTGIVEKLKRDLLDASISFHRRGQRKKMKLTRIYCSFDLPYLTVSKEQAQRNSARRLERFGIREELLRGKSLLDLGSHNGGMIFASQKYQPGMCLGVEYDADKVRVARQVAAYNGLNNVKFLCRDIDKISIEELEGPFDVVYCLAIIAHVNKPKRLYRLLGKVTSGLLCFEGNASTDPHEVASKLRDNGFREINYLGYCDDDCLEENNCRPMLVAVK